MKKLVDSLASRKILIAWLESRATVTLECLPEDLVIEGNCSAIDPETDREQEQWIYEQLQRGNEWAWCTAKVTVSWHGITSEDYLGACSYESERSFRESMYVDMVRCCCVDIVSQLFAARETLDHMWACALATPDVPDHDAAKPE